MTFTLTGEFVVSGATPDQISEAGGRLMDELIGLEDAACGIHSSAVSVDTSRSLVTVEVSVDGDDQSTAVAVAQSCIRAAIHATGGYTPSWVSPADVTPELLTC